MFAALFDTTTQNITTIESVDHNDPDSMPVYDGRVDLAFNVLEPGNYPVLDESDEPAELIVTATASWLATDLDALVLVGGAE